MTKTMLREAERHADDCEACIGTGWLTACMNAAPCPFCNSRGLEPDAYEKRRKRQREFDAKQHLMTGSTGDAARARRMK